MADQRIVVFDLETIPDVTAGKLSLGLPSAIDDGEARERLNEAYRREGQTPAQVFVKSVLHKIVCVGAMYADRSDRNAGWSITRFGAVHIGMRDEREIVSGFIDSLSDAPAPQLIGFNSSSFDLPVLRYRALALGVPAPVLHRGNGRDYWYRFGRDHLDICDFISSFGAATRPSLAELGSIVGLAVKTDGIDGSQVERLVAEGKIEDVASYCESDVLATYLVFLKLSFVTGELGTTGYRASISELYNFASQRLEKRPHLLRFVDFLTRENQESI